MSIMSYRVRFASGFRDGNVFPRTILPNEIVVVDEATYTKMKASDPDIETIERVVPNPEKKRAAHDTPEG